MDAAPVAGLLAVAGFVVVAALPWAHALSEAIALSLAALGVACLAVGVWLAVA